MLIDLNGYLIGLVCVTTFVVMVYWHVTVRGRWHRYSSGKSLMGLLGIITGITALATFSTFYGPFPARPVVYAVAYVLLEVAILLVGFSIIGAQRSRPRDENRTINRKENSK